MATTLEQVRDYLNDLGVTVSEVDAENDQVLFFLSPLNLSLRCFINVYNDGKYVAVTCYPAVPDDAALDPLRREQVLECLNHFNARFAYGRWALTRDDTPRATFHLHLEDAVLTRRQLWSVLFIIKDLVVLQAQCLQLLIATGIQQPLDAALLTGTAIQAALAHPSRVGDIARALRLAPEAAAVLHELVGATPADADEDVVAVGREADGLPGDPGDERGAASADEDIVDDGAPARDWLRLN